MTLTQLLILALIQGITEFLPISSSGHLILLPGLTGAPDQGQVIDVAVHLGTLLAVLLYFRTDTAAIIRGLPRLARGRADTKGSRLALLLIIATIPVVLFGVALKLTGLDDHMRSIAVIGWTMLGFGLVLWWTDRRGAHVREAADWNLKDALRIGAAQALALIPGTSRSGITITAARALGYQREDAARLSMLMSIPAIIASGTFLGAEVIANADAAMAKDGAIAAVLAFVSALGALALMMRLLRSISFTPYVIYRVILGGILLFIAYG